MGGVITEDRDVYHDDMSSCGSTWLGLEGTCGGHRCGRQGAGTLDNVTGVIGIVPTLIDVIVDIILMS